MFFTLLPCPPSHRRWVSVDLAELVLEPHTVLLQEMSECGFGWIASVTPHCPVTGDEWVWIWLDFFWNPTPSCYRRWVSVDLAGLLLEPRTIPCILSASQPSWEPLGELSHSPLHGWEESTLTMATLLDWNAGLWLYTPSSSFLSLPWLVVPPLPPPSFSLRMA